MENQASAVDRVLAANAQFALDYDPRNLSPMPYMRLACLTRLDAGLPRTSLVLQPQDAHIIRNAGGVVTEDAIRSLLISHYLLNTNEIILIHPTRCGMIAFTHDL